MTAPTATDVRASPARTEHARLALVLVCLAQFLVVVDGLTVSVALPAIGEGLDVRPGLLPWVLQAYMLTYGGSIGVGGRLGDLFGHRRVLVTGLTVFGLASLLAGSSQDVALLLAGRAAQGLGSGLVLPSAMALLVAGRDEAQRARAMAVWAVVGSSGVVAGALLGGAVTQLAGWRWLFLGNLPLVALMLAGTPLLPRARAGTRQRLDVRGALLLTTGTALLLYAFVVGEDGPRPDAVHGLCALAGVLLLAGFVRSQRTERDPLVPPRLLHLPSVRAAGVGSVAMNGGFAVVLVFGSLHLQDVRGYDALTAGLALLPLAAISAVAGPLAARLVRRAHPPVVAAAGLLLMAAGFVVLALSPADGGFALVFLPGSLLLGFGISLAYVPLTLLAVDGVEESERGVASGVYNTFGQTGSAVVLALVAAVAAARAGSAAADTVRTAYLAVTVLLVLGAVAVRSTRSR